MATAQGFVNSVVSFLACFFPSVLPSLARCCAVLPYDMCFCNHPHSRHEDGTVRFWDASGVCLHLLYKLSTVRVFLTDADPNDNMNTLGEDEWPPLRKVR